MRVIRRLPKQRHGRPLSLAIGVFDGMHLGHQAVVKAALQSPGLPAALTFEDAPERLLAPEHAPPRLIHPQERLEQLEAAGIRLAWVLPFTRALASMKPEDFARKILIGKLNCRSVSVGEDFRYGKGAKGTPHQLRDFGLQVTIVPAKKLGGHVISSTRLRLAVTHGRLKEAERMLGRPWRLRGVVVKGQGLGRQLGVPTANWAVKQEVLPPLGVWAGRCRKAPNGPWKSFAANLGYRPTVGGKRLALEFHLLGFKGNLLGQTWEAEFQKFLRPEKKFDGLGALKAQIAKDLLQAARQAKK
jgi:riboflavin kinase/FMN adenylyltransferase